MRKIFFILKVPPPVHGSTLMNKKVMESISLKEHFDCYYFPLSVSKDVSDIGRFSFRKILAIFISYTSLFKSLKKVKPELVYFAVSPYGLAFIKDFFFYFIIIKTWNVPVVFHHHGKGVRNHGERNRIYRYLYWFMFKDNYHICLAKELIEDISLYVTKAPFIIANGIENHGIKKNRDSTKNRRARILFISNYTRSKGILVLLDAANLLHQGGTEFELSIIGKPYDISETELVQYINEAGLFNIVKLLGPKYDQEKFTCISQHDFLVFPTFYENETFGLVLIEAMQCGLPVISTREGGIPSVIDDEVNGFLVAKNDSEALANKMKLLIDNPALVSKMGLNAEKKYEENFTLERFESGIVTVLKSLLKEI